MTTLFEVPVSAGSADYVLFEVDSFEVPAELELASDDLGRASARAIQSLEESLARLGPSLQHVLGFMRRHAPDEAKVEFGLKMGGESGIIIAKGTAEVNFVVTMTWKNSST